MAQLNLTKSWKIADNHSWKAVKPIVKKSVKEEAQERWKQHPELKLAKQMNADLDWKFAAYNLP